MHRHSHEGRPHRRDPVRHILEKALLRQRRAAIDDEVQPVKTRGGELVAIGFGEEIARQLITHEVVITQVLVEGLDHPVTIGDIVPVEVLVHAVGVGEAHQVQPVPRHVLAILRFCKEALDERFVGLGTIVCQEGADLLRSRRKTGEIERQPPDEGALVGLLRRSEPLGFEPLQNVQVDRLLAPGFVLHPGCLGHHGRDKRPELLVGSPRFDPALDDVLLRLREGPLVGLFGRHEIVRVGGRDSVPKFTFLQRSRLDGGNSILGPVGSLLSGGLVQPEIRLALPGVRPVAGKTSIREDRTHVAVERDLPGKGAGPTTNRQDRGARDPQTPTPENRSPGHLTENLAPCPAPVTETNR